jgi:hypothetical protein
MDLTDHRNLEIRSYIKKVSRSSSNDMNMEQFCIGIDYIQELTKNLFLEKQNKSKMQLMRNLFVFSILLFAIIIVILIGVKAFGAYGPFASLVTSIYPICNKNK